MATPILHLSDLHLGVANSETRMQRLVDRVLELFHNQPLTIIITGDLIDSPLTRNAYQQADVHFNRLHAAGFHIFVIPGNHDYGVGFFNWPPNAKKFAKHYFQNSEQIYPKLDIIDDVAFIGLDSSAAELRWYNMWFPNGQIGAPQLERLAQILNTTPVKQARHRVLYMHHHPNDSGFFMGLKDWNPLHKLIDKPGLFSAILFGHRHLVAPHGKASKQPFLHIDRIYDAGASLQKKGYPQGPHRLIDLDTPMSHDKDLCLLSV